MNKNKANKLDAILMKFRGNISIPHFDPEDNRFKDIGGYYEIENHLNLLEADGMIKRDITGKKLLTPKGIAAIADMKDLGYESKTKTKIFNFERICWVLSLALAAIATWYAAKSYYKQETRLISDETITQQVNTNQKNNDGKIPNNINRNNDSSTNK